MPLPKLWLQPVRDGYSVTPGKQNVVIQLDGGAPRVRADQLGANATVTINWILGQADYDYLLAFYRSQLSSGSLPFLIDLLFESSQPVEYTAQFINDGGPQLKSQSGLTYYVTATLSVAPSGDYSGDASLIGRNSYPS
jgi:hypothetical protein